MKRRDLLTLLGGTAAAWSVVARAQQPAMPVIAVLSNTSRQADEELRLPPFHAGLKETGYIVGQNVAAEFRWAEDRYDRLAELAGDLLRYQPAVIATLGGSASALAAKAATSTIPIVFGLTGDPMELGLVTSFSRPIGNVTGVSTFPGLLVAKQFEAVQETVPTATVIGCLLNPGNPNSGNYARQGEEAARKLGRKLELVYASTDAEIEEAFAILVQKRIGALVVMSDGLFNSRPAQLAALAIRHRIPPIFPLREYVRAGGLMSYGTSISETYHQAGIYAGRIIKGAKPADLPVVQLSKVELAINVLTAKALGISFPLSLLGRADEVIE
jgi:putative ABC transport system substrate-binding protein